MSTSHGRSSHDEHAAAQGDECPDCGCDRTKGKTLCCSGCDYNWPSAPSAANPHTGFGDCACRDCWPADPIGCSDAATTPESEPSSVPVDSRPSQDESGRGSDAAKPQDENVTFKDVSRGGAEGCAMQTPDRSDAASVRPFEHTANDVLSRLQRAEEWYGFSGISDDVAEILRLVEDFGEASLIRLVRKAAYGD